MKLKIEKKHIVKLKLDINKFKQKFNMCSLIHNVCDSLVVVEKDVQYKDGELKKFVYLAMNWTPVFDEINTLQDINFFIHRVEYKDKIEYKEGKAINSYDHVEFLFDKEELSGNEFILLNDTFGTTNYQIKSYLTTKIFKYNKETKWIPIVDMRGKQNVF